jgi:hypothetical protein
MGFSLRNLFRRPGKPPETNDEMSEEEFQRIADAQEGMVEQGNKMDNPVDPYDPLWKPVGGDPPEDPE